MHVETVWADIKNMYTELSHDAILTALRWLLGVSARSRSKRICIMRKGRGGVRWGRSYDACNATTMALDELYHIIQWDLDHEVFALGNMVLRQLFGIGMGAPTSPSLAILVCAHCEHEFFASVYDACHFTPQLVAGTRYIDDVAQWFAV